MPCLFSRGVPEALVLGPPGSCPFLCPSRGSAHQVGPHGQGHSECDRILSLHSGANPPSISAGGSVAEDVCVSSPLAQRHDHEAIHGKLDHLSNGLWESSPRHSCIRAREIASVSRDQERQGEEQGCSPAGLAAWWAAHMLGRLRASPPARSHPTPPSQAKDANK